MFAGQIQKLIARIGPWFLHGINIGRFLEAVGVTLDASVTELDQGLRLSQPLRCDESALPVLSKDRGIRLYPTEPTASKRLRLSRWLQLHRQRGTHIGELKHSQPYFLPDTPQMRIVHQDGAGNTATWWTIAADGSVSVHAQTPSNWNYDGQISEWSRFWVILYVPAAMLHLHTWDDGCAYDDGTTFYDGIIDSQIARDLIGMILEWQAAHSHLAAYILATDPASFDPTATATTSPSGWTSLPVGNWGSPISGGVRTRPPSALWIYES